MRNCCFSLAGACVLLAASMALADGPGGVSFEDDVLPLLKARCVKCHGPVKREGELNLAAPRSIARGGESGSAVDREQALKSLLWERIDGALAGRFLRDLRVRLQTWGESDYSA